MQPVYLFSVFFSIRVNAYVVPHNSHLGLNLLSKKTVLLELVLFSNLPHLKYNILKHSFKLMPHPYAYCVFYHIVTFFKSAKIKRYSGRLPGKREFMVSCVLPFYVV